LSPRFIFFGIGYLGLALGIFSAAWPKRSIGLYQGIMERFNWKVTPIDEPREVRNTRTLGGILVALSLVLFYMVFFRF
jgi:hypothetical protein